MTNQQLSKLASYLTLLHNHFYYETNPTLWEAVKGSIFSLRVAVLADLKDANYQRALRFAQSIPDFTNFDCKEFHYWVATDTLHLEFHLMHGVEER